MTPLTFLALTFLFFGVVYLFILTVDFSISKYQKNRKKDTVVFCLLVSAVLSLLSHV